MTHTAHVATLDELRKATQQLREHALAHQMPQFTLFGWTRLELEELFAEDGVSFDDGMRAFPHTMVAPGVYDAVIKRRPL
jgi:hypothetical protein